MTEQTKPVLTAEQVQRIWEIGGYDKAAFDAELQRMGLIAPEPHVDPLLEEAREIVHRVNVTERGDYYKLFAEDVLRGTEDDHLEVLIALAALRRGMELRPELTRGQVVDACMAVGISRFMHSLDFDRLHAALTDGGRDE